jgi:very-short-patch-repair endonuclease
MTPDPNPIAGLVRRAIAELRLKLLDLTNRNRLLNFKFPENSRKFVRVVDDSPDALYARLTDDGARNGRLNILPLPEPPADPDLTDEDFELDRSDGTPSAERAGKTRNAKRRTEARSHVQPAEWAKQNGINPSLDLTDGDAADSGGVSRNEHIQTLLFPDVLERRLAAIREDANLAQQELGLSTLFAAFGFLEWYEATDSNQPLYSPLFLLPVQMDRELKHGKYRYFIECGEGADATGNVSLRERLKRDFGLALPELEEDDTPESYIERVRPILQDQPRWTIRRFVVIGHFSFARLVMYEDLQPEAWEHAPLEANPLISTLLGGALEGAREAHAPDFDVDSEEIERVVPVTITDADSSQFSAIIDAMQGRSFALKGPPGTGKSQTITNLIAAALAANKRVLFVAEKQAALDVVAKRLREAGLDPFLLELHSTKAQKKKILEGLEARLALPQTRGDRQHEATLAELRKTRRQLKSFVEALNAPLGESGVTLHEAYWSESRARHGLEVGELGLAGATGTFAAQEMTPHISASCQQLLDRVAEAYTRCVGSLESLLQHPLYGVGRLGSDPDEPRILREHLENCDRSLDRLQRVASHGSTAFSCPFPATATGLADLSRAVSALPPVSAPIDVALLARLRTEEDLTDLRAFCSLLSDVLRGRAAVAEKLVDVDEAIAAAGDLTSRAESLHSITGDLDLGEGTLQELPALVDRRRVEFSGMASLLAILDRFAEVAGLSRPLTGATLGELVDLAALLESTPADVLRARAAPLFNSDVRGQIAIWDAEARALNAESDAVSGELTIAFDEDPRELANHGRNLRDTHPLVGLLSSQYRAARRRYRDLSRRRWPGRAQAAAQLLAAADLIERREHFSNQDQLKAVAGATYAGVRTSFTTLLATVDFCTGVRRRWPTFDPQRAVFQQLLLTGETGLLEDFVASLSSAGVPLLRQLAAKTAATPDEPAAIRIASLQARLAVATADVRALLSRSFKVDIPVARLRELSTDLTNLAAAEAKLSGAAMSDALPQGRRPDGSDANRLAATCAFAGEILAAPLPREITASILSSKAIAALSAMKQFCTLLSDGCRAHEAARAAAVERFRIELAKWFEGCAAEAVDIGTERARLQAAIQSTDMVAIDWAVYLDVAQQCAAHGLAGFPEALEARAVRPSALAAVFRLAYYRGLVRAASWMYPDLPQWTGQHIEGLRRRLVDLDHEYMKTSRAALARALARNEVPVGVSYGPVKNRTDRSLIEHEIGKQRRHIPIRRLMHQAARAMRALKPCFMMSPASVAQFLPPGGAAFDLAIIDEASQMRPEEALGVVARAKQLVVVGDPMQLPPTTFFDATQDDSREVRDEEELDVDTESILDMALSSFRPPRQLRWHYRSKHHSLIAFSNRQFYGDQLIVFPSPKGRTTNMGVQWVPVEGAIYDASVNVTEAEVVVHTVSALMAANPKSSIGVVTMNLPQKDLLVERFDELFAKEPHLEDYRANWAPTLEPFFVKNLENVQGDERDIIVISTVYGSATAGGPVAQRFGPINSKMGHRRLNVLFTRAKERVVVVSSLRPEDIRPTTGTSRGIDAFKAYLEYARSGRLEAGTKTNAAFDSPFEAEVAAVLAQHGYRADAQVGVAGYFIDLAVRHPVDADHFVLGIECDGASYHSAKSARDRDRLRQEILERLGWRLHRIWSTDWFQARDREVKRLRDRVTAALAEWTPAVQRGDVTTAAPAGPRPHARSAASRDAEGDGSEDVGAITRETATATAHRVAQSDEKGVDEATIAALARAHGMEITDYRPKGGALWVSGSDVPEISRQLKAWGFQFKPGRGWWRK